jgi:NTP pyrophosphatase (non-canonical NTP hydrolase)
MHSTTYLEESARTENTDRDRIVSSLYSDNNAELLHGSIGIVTEAGELIDAIKKNLIYGKPLDSVNVIEEVGDILWYVALVLRSQGSTFEEAFERNIAKLRVRFPEKYSDHSATVRDLQTERKALEQ